MGGDLELRFDVATHTLSVLSRYEPSPLVSLLRIVAARLGFEV